MSSDLLKRLTIRPSPRPERPLATKPSGSPQTTARTTKPFLRGPIDWEWLAACARVPGRGLHVAIAVCMEIGMRNETTVTLRPKFLRELGVDADAARRALSKMEDAGLVKVHRAPGRAHRVTMLGGLRLRPTRERSTQA